MATVTIRQPVDATTLATADRLVDDTRAVADATTADVFPQSVASGGPTPTGVVLWTRIAPAHYDPAATLRLAVATDPSFDDLVTRVALEGPGVKPDDDYTVRVDLDGALDPDSTYHYRFGYRGVRSPTGRCRTLPAADASPESVRFGLLNCQNYQNGYFGAMAHLARTDVDFVVHLGDYVYERVADGYPNGPDGPYADRRIDLPDGETVPVGLDDYRHLYETYKADPHLRALHERHTVVQTWDDHAIADDRYWDYEADAPVFPEHPCGDVPAVTRSLTRAGIQAWWEFVPARITYDPEADHVHDSFELYRALRFGDLVTLLLTDERLYRSRPRSLVEKLRGRLRPDPSRTMLGTDQRDWFLGELRDSDATWTVWANAVLFSPLTLGLRWLTLGRDSWNGFEAERRTVLATFAEVAHDATARGRDVTANGRETTARGHDATASGRDATARGRDVTANGRETTARGHDATARGHDATASGRDVTASGRGTNVVTLTGDMHTTLATRIQCDDADRTPVGVEFMTPGVTSVNMAEKVADALGGGVGGRYARRVAVEWLQRLLRAVNREYALLDSAHWGYSVVEFARDACTWDVYWVDKTANSAAADREAVTRVRVPVGEDDLRKWPLKTASEPPAGRRPPRSSSP